MLFRSLRGNGSRPRGLDVERLEPRALLAAVAWDGEAGDGDWHNPLNWEGDVLPGAGDDVTIGADPTPDITIAAGESVEIASLDLGKALTLAGVLDVTGSTHIRQAALTILVSGQATTADLTLDAAVNAENAGSWTISGVSRIEGAITNSGTLTLANRSTTVLGTNIAATSPGEIENSGLLRIGARAALSGTASGQAQLSTTGVVSFGSLATVSDLTISADRPAVGPTARLEFSGTLATVLLDCTLDIGDVVVDGRLDAAGLSLTVSGDTTITGVVRLDEASIVVSGILQTAEANQAPVGRLEVFNSTMTLGSDEPDHGWLGGSMRIEGSTVTLVGDTTFQDDLVLVDSTIEGAFGVEVYGSLRLDGTTVGSGVQITVNYGGISLEGDGVHRILGQIVVDASDRYEHGSLHWTGGQIVLEGADSRISVTGGDYGQDVGFVLAPVRGVAEISGEGTLIVGLGVTMEVESDVTISATLDNGGIVRVTDVSLELTGVVVQITIEDAAARPQTPWGLGQPTSVHLTGGSWQAIFDAKLYFPQRVDWNSATIVLEDDGAIPNLGNKDKGGQLHNDGQIVLRGTGNRGLNGSGIGLRLSNAGSIRAGGFWNLEGDLWNAATGDFTTSGKITVYGNQVTNLGKMTIGGTLRTSGDFTQHAGARLLMSTQRQGGTFNKSVIRVGGVMNLGGRLRFDMPEGGASTAALDMSLLKAKLGRVGTFGKVALNVGARTGQLVYGANEVRVLAGL